MTDRYENIRKALEMGPTPGPWELKDGRTDTIENAQGYPVCTVHWHPDERYGHGVRAAYIAACDPDTVHALLAERDALTAALEAAREDSERLDALEALVDEQPDKALLLHHGLHKRSEQKHACLSLSNTTLRQSIDAAIDQARGKGVA